MPSARRVSWIYLKGESGEKGKAGKMGLEKEKAETCVFMDEDVFHSTIEPILKKEKERERTRAPPLHRDPRDINAHLKVSDTDVSVIQMCRITETFELGGGFIPYTEQARALQVM